MLVPILLLQTNIKQILHQPFAQEKDKGLIVQIWDLIDRFINQWHWQLITTTRSDYIYYLSHQQQQPHQQLDNQYNYVLACSHQKNSQIFQEMTNAEKQEFLQKLKLDYRQIVIDYFISDKALKEKIDKFINSSFYASVPVPQIIEIHMEVIDEFAKQLRLEGRSDESLLDYRLTLIDILAHLCEVYRSSIAKIS
jgi:circadian clock protein KaiA